VSAGPRRADLSQHFLRKGATAARLVRGTTISRSDLVVEIGAGRGALTLPLARVAQRVIAVEIDATLIANLRSQFDDRIELVCSDFLQTPLPSAPYKAFGNVPFSRTTDIVSKLVRAPNPPRDAWLVVQREAAHRFCGRPYVRESLWLHRRDRPLLCDSEARMYEQLIERAYSANMSLSRTTGQWLSKIQLRRLASDLRFDYDCAPSVLGFEQWLGLVRFIHRMRA
jgi:SAM-dependent methyltransferase